ncbi:hypothetical protein PR202_ga23244 [Eleusine coracana subsp. coracana]|uniref:C2H2-type domain-containing protein n=1 Tax=Eleusine coracana subsp. coracana TaxID=191504 RepID=A0AAV5D5R7_ELECO|nr:hypothetical protein PR202_ga23244 [Eleusine coracana subsp. coracana]
MDPSAAGGDLDLNLSLQPSQAPESEPPGYFICSYCGKKFCSPQAFGGHQNAHKLERSVTKRALELAAARRFDGQGDAQAKKGKKPVGIAASGKAASFLWSHQIIKASPEASRDSIAEDMDLSLKL